MRGRRFLLAAAFSIIAPCLGCHAAGVDSGAPNAAVVPADLLDKARHDGWVRVVVNLRIRSGPTEEAVRAAREAVFGDLGSAPYRVLRQYDTIPAVALVASTDALMRLAGSSHVTSVQEDMPLEPKR